MKHGFSSSKSVYLGILLLGTASLIGNVGYEGSRSIVPDYLEFLS